MSNYAVVCLDETGSMRGQEHRVVTSMNEYVAKLPDDTHITVFKFDSERWDKFFDDNKKEWKVMEVDDYKPGAMTPLYDKVSETIKHAESLSKDKDNDKVMIMIDTDGIENASIEENQESIKVLVEQKKSAGWEFWFMANGLDQKTADKIGKAGASLGMNVASNVHRVRHTAYSNLAVDTVSYFNRDSNQKNK